LRLFGRPERAAFSVSATAGYIQTALLTRHEMKLIKKLSASRDEKKVRERNRVQKQVQKKHEAVDRSIADLADARSEAIRLLKRVVWVLGDNAGARSGGAILSPDSLSPAPPFSKTIFEIQAAVGTTTALGVGGAGAAGTVAVASTWGTASTGTGIALLNGAAKTSAVLAWIGGWIGGGVIAGVAVLTAISAAPAVIYTIWKLNPSDHRIELNNIRATLKHLEKADDRIRAIADSISQCNRCLRREHDTACRLLYGGQSVRRVVRWVRRLLYGTMFRRTEVNWAEPLRCAATLVAKAAVQEILDNRGVSKGSLIYPPIRIV
jgi:hypothetical protein